MDYINDKVIVRSNENEPPAIGILRRFEHSKDSRLPVVEIDGQEMLCFSIVVPYSTPLFQALEGMPPKIAWSWLAKECQEGRVERIR